MIDTYEFCKEIKITSHAFSTCLYHSLTTDEEEVMGILFGICAYDAYNNPTVHVLSNLSLIRTCKEKDRVEFDEIQLTKAIEYADEINKKYNFTKDDKIKVIGWYHSHPKITHPPSIVDLKTQYFQQYQGVFVGLIFSVFSNDKFNLQRANLISFQTSQDSNNDYIPIYQNIIFEENLKYHESIIEEFSSGVVYHKIIDNIINEIDEDETQYSSQLSELYKNSEEQKILCKIIDCILQPMEISQTNEIEYIEGQLEYYENLNKILEEKLDIYKNNE